MGKNTIEENNLGIKMDDFNGKLDHAIELIDKILEKIDIDTVDEDSLAYHTSMSYMELKSSLEKIIKDNEKLKKSVQSKGYELDNLDSEQGK